MQLLTKVEISEEAAEEHWRRRQLIQSWIFWVWDENAGFWPKVMWMVEIFNLKFKETSFGLEKNIGNPLKSGRWRHRRSDLWYDSWLLLQGSMCSDRQFWKSERSSKPQRSVSKYYFLGYLQDCFNVSDLIKDKQSLRGASPKYQVNLLLLNLSLSAYSKLTNAKRNSEKNSIFSISKDRRRAHIRTLNLGEDSIETIGSKFVVSRASLVLMLGSLCRSCSCRGFHFSEIFSTWLKLCCCHQLEFWILLLPLKKLNLCSLWPH